MEKISATCAMEWSIELEKGLRSKKPGHRIEAIKRIGHKLQQWSMEPSITLAISDVYDMVPGEDILFANTIILRLADAFCNGDIEVRRCILKVFLVELQHITKKGKNYDGILARKRVPNHLELLKRLLTVYDSGDLEAKCLTLRMFGCWACLATDSSHICFLIHKSMQSNHDLEVKASLFAAGCFSRLSEDFAYIFLKILISIISSITRSPDVRLEAVRALAKLQCSSAITEYAYQAGRRVLLDLPVDDVKAEMLSSLSKLASKTTLIYLDQSFLNHEYPIPLKARALRCLHFLLVGGSCHFPVRKNILSALCSMFDDNNLPLSLQCLSLQILCKIFSTRQLNLPVSDIPDLVKVLVVVKNSDIPMTKRRLALNLLIDILCSMKKGGKEHYASSANWLSNIAQLQGSSSSGPLTSSGCSLTLLINNISFLIMDQVNFLVKEIICSCHKEVKCVENLKSGSELFVLKKELKSILYLILRLVQEDSSSCLVAFSKLRCIVHYLVSLLTEGRGETCIASEAVSPKETNYETNDIVFRPLESDGEKITVILAFILCLCRFANACISILHETNSITSEVRHILKDVVNCIKLSECSCYYSFEVFCLIVHSFVFDYGFKEVKGNKVKVGDEICCPHSIFWFHQECLALDFTKKILRRGNYWEVYKAGKYSCLQGLWFAATFSFRKLIDVAKSGNYSNWIKALMLYVGGESEIKLLLFPRAGLELINSFQYSSDSDQPFRYSGGETNACVGEGYDWNAFRANLSRVCGRISSSEKVLEGSADFNGVFFFQRWFLNLRGNFLQIVAETLSLLCSSTLAEEKYKNSTRLNPLNASKVTHDMHTLVCALARVSFRVNNLAKGYDLLATSFMDIDAVSFRGISRLGFICSTLAFCTSFATNVLNRSAFKNIISSSATNLEIYSNLKIVQDLVERLMDIDYTIARKLMKFILAKEEIKHGLYSKMNIHGPTLFDNVSLSLIQSAISGILCVQVDLEVVDDEEDLIAIFLRGLQHLFCFITKWMEIPLITPKYFFSVRPCIGSELYIFHANSCHRDEILVKSGVQLPLNLCIKLKNASKKKCASITKIYCVLAVRAADRFTNGSGRLAPAQCLPQTHKAEDTLWLSEILLLLLRANNAETDKEHQNVVDDGSFLATLACFEPNKMGLGFSTCLLNISHLPEGSYPIKWHSCCVDDRGFYWNLLSLNNESVFTIKKT
ncbi:uncharacterized protein LOC110101407 isoform X2 [Dendrobium catenatum]|uniref:uncharacterized protein LOC110101407 isoform X2 n=1 Tax=Dendrobium catenatum TaxID=906689 RepID=UPI0009F69036|nr:uncharacterized protein LOC110101407 isoform X2 [Dendrobium catenatum]